MKGRSVSYPVFFLALAMCMAACSGSFKKEPPLATAYDDELHFTDLENTIPKGLSAADSLAFLRKAVDEWLNNRIRLHKAGRYVKNMDAINRQVDDYCNSLLLYEYEKRLLQERLDTAIIDEEIIRYYEANKHNFVLQRNVLKLNFVKVQNDPGLVKEFRKLIQSSKASDREKLALMCSNQAANWYLDDAVWLDFQDIIKEIPIKTYDEEQFLSNNKYLEIKEGEYIYLVKILDYRVRNSNSGLEFEKDAIRQILLNKRKAELLRKMESDTRKEAELEQQVKVFVR